MEYSAIITPVNEVGNGTSITTNFPDLGTTIIIVKGNSNCIANYLYNEMTAVPGMLADNVTRMTQPDDGDMLYEIPLV